MDENEKVTAAPQAPVEAAEAAPAREAKPAPAAPSAADSRPAARPQQGGYRPQSGGDRPYRGGGQGGPRGGGRRKKVCQFCVDRTLSEIDYKDAAKLRKFMSERAKIIPRRVTGTCARHQRELTIAIKRARQIAILPYISD